MACVWAPSLLIPLVHHVSPFMPRSCKWCVEEQAVSVQIQSSERETQSSCGQNYINRLYNTSLPCYGETETESFIKVEICSALWRKGMCSRVDHQLGTSNGMSEQGGTRG